MSGRVDFAEQQRWISGKRAGPTFQPDGAPTLGLRGPVAINYCARSCPIRSRLISLPNISSARHE